MTTTEEEMVNISDIWQFELRRGNSPNPREGACLLDAVSWFEYGTLGDHPPCVCPVIAAFSRSINDTLSYKERQRLIPYIPKLSGTVDPEAVVKRAEYLAWQAIRVFAPLVFDRVELPSEAQKLRMFQGTLQEAPYVITRAGYSPINVTHANDVNGVARAAARAARAAAHAATAFWAVDDAVDVARAAARVVNYASSRAIEDAMIAALDGVLKIGKQADTIDPSRILEANRTFALATAR